jgi:hypothetical protein
MIRGPLAGGMSGADGPGVPIACVARGAMFAVETMPDDIAWTFLRHGFLCAFQSAFWQSLEQ